MHPIVSMIVANALLAARPQLCLLLALLHNLLVAQLKVPDTRLCMDLVDPHVLLVVPLEGIIVACLLSINIHIDIEALGLVNPISSWLHAG
jgi:hypothetical protein